MYNKFTFTIQFATKKYHFLPSGSEHAYIKETAFNLICPQTNLMYLSIMRILLIDDLFILIFFAEIRVHWMEVVYDLPIKWTWHFWTIFPHLLLSEMLV